MKRTLRAIASLLVFILLCGSLPVLSISSETLSSPFDSTILSDSANSIKSVTVNSSENIGNGGEVSLFKATISSTGTRKVALKSLLDIPSNTFEDTFEDVTIATGGKLFVYSKPASDGQNFANNYINDIAAQFEADHPEWKVAVVSNASFFDNETNKTADKGEPEDIYVQDGKVYKSYIEKGEDGNDVFKIGRGIVGLKDDGTMIYHTIENGTSHYTGSTAYGFDAKYTLEVLGENKNNSIYEYNTLLPFDEFDYTSDPVFLTPSMGAKNLSGATVYMVKCSQYRRAHVGVNGREVGTKTHYFEGTIESIVSGTSSMTASSGYVYIASYAYAPLEHLQVGVTVRGTQKMIGSWADIPYVFGYKQQILHEGTVLFNGTHQESYGGTISGSYDKTWSEDHSYGTYGSNRTAVGFKADGTPVIITMPRKIHGTYVVVVDGKNVTKYKETSATYSEMAWYMKSIGCVNAFMMDCGGSTGMYKKSTGSDTYEVACCDPILTAPNRAVANALILAYPSGKSAAPTDEKLAEPSFDAGYITATTNPKWYAGLTKLRSTATVKNSYSGTFSTDSTLSKTNFTLAQDGAIYTFAPKSTAFSSGYEAVYAYKNLGYTVEEGKKYTYCFKLHTLTKGKYTSFLFGEYPSNTSKSKMLNNFAVVGGAFSNNGDTTGYSDVRTGVGRIELNDKLEKPDIFGLNQEMTLQLETVNGKKYSQHRIDIDGLNYTLKSKDSSGAWVQVGGTYELPTGTKLIMGCASWEANTSRAMSVRDPVCIDVTDLSKNIASVNALNSEEYTADSWATVEAAKARADYSVQLTYQNLVDFADTQLTTATNGLVKRMDVTDSNIAVYEEENAELYTAKSWAAYQTAYEALIAAKNANNLSEMDSLNAAFAKAQSELVDAVVSLEISWNTLSFSYTNGDLNWDPNTHTYQSDNTTKWTPYENSNIIDVTNNSNIDLNLDLEFIPEAVYESVSGEFYINDTPIQNNSVIAEAEKQTFVLQLSGQAPSTPVGDYKGGTVKITVSRGE